MRITARGALMQTRCLFTNSNMMRCSKIHANSVVSPLIYLEQRLKSPSDTVCARESFTFTHKLFHWKPSATPQPGNVGSEEEPANGGFHLRFLILSCCLKCKSRSRFSSVTNTFAEFFCATQATFPPRLHVLVLTTLIFQTWM